MPDNLKSTLAIAASGMRAQGTRLKVIAENLANASSTAETPGGDPYRRQVVTFENVLNKQLDADLVSVRKVDRDMSDFRKVFDPNHPAADEQGYVAFPNVNTLIEMADMREAQRSYEANLNVIDVSKQMMQRSIDLLR